MKSKPFSIVLRQTGGWHSAVCPELTISGFGGTQKAAIESVATSMQSKLSALAFFLKQNPRNLTRVAKIVKPS